MPITASLPPAATAQKKVFPATNGRGYLWSAVLIGVGFPKIFCSQFGYHPGVWLPLAEIAILLGLAIFAARVHPSKDLPGFILAIAAVNFGWLVVVPWIEGSSLYRSISSELSWEAKFFLSRSIRLIGVPLMLLTLIGSGIGRRELFLRIGNWRAHVRPEPFLRFGSITWARFTMILLIIFGVALPFFLTVTLHPELGRLSHLPAMLPLALLTSVVNAASEEFQFRSVLLARLRRIVSDGEAFLLCAVFFGIGHYFGQPSGWAGAFMAGIAGWLWAKSMVETNGFTCAFAMHFVQDLIIFSFLAISLGAQH